MMTSFAIALGGALGALSRYWLATAVARHNSVAFPLGTFAVNVLGSFLIGLVFLLLLQRADLEQGLRPFLITGFLGAMTTFSTFSLEALLLLQQGHYNTALLYVLGSVLTCLLAAFAGMQLGRALF